MTNEQTDLELPEERGGPWQWAAIKAVLWSGLLFAVIVVVAAGSEYLYQYMYPEGSTPITIVRMTLLTGLILVVAVEILHTLVILLIARLAALVRRWRSLRGG